MSRKKMFRNTLAIILTALMGLSLPVQVFATTLPKDEKIYSSFDDVQGNTEIIGNIVTEISDERSETTKEFLLDDGTKLIAEYDQPIHYKDDNGNWVEYDNSLVSATATADETNTEYSAKNSDIDIKLSNKAKSNNMIKITSDDYSISWGYDNANKSKINIIENNEALVGNEAFTTLKNITQEAVYEDVYKNVDLQYFVSSTGVKENIILKSSDVQNEFNLTYKINNLTAKQTDDYTITLYNKNNEVVYKILAPYMTDAKGNSSNQLKLEITSQKGSNLNVKLTADYWFIKSLGRSFPITIDPELTNKLTSKLTMNQNINNTVVSYGPYYTSSNGYIVAKINSLPTLGDGEKIISAKFNFEATNGSTLFTSESDTPIIINAHKLTSIVSNVSQYDTTVLDYDSLTYNDNKNLTFDLTKTLNDWYDNGEEIDGFVLEAFDTVGSKQVNLQHSTVSSLTPSFTIIYKDFTGTESNLTYHTVPVGYNATAEVSDYLGNLVITQNLYEGTGSRMPVTLTATYNSINYDKTFANGSPSGYGWQFSFNQYVRDAGEDLAEAGYDYIYTDADGTDHYLKKSDDAEEWYDEDGLGITLTKTDTNILIDDGTITQTYELTTAGGKLLSEKDEHDNTINYTYTDGNLTSITDGSKCEENNNVGREFNFVYYTTSDGAKRVRYIVLPDANRIYFYYTSSARDKISYILFPDNRITRFTYSEDERIVAVEQAILTTSTGIVTNSKVAFTYNTKAQISNITEYGSDNSEGNYLNFVYGNDNTTQVSDRYARSVTYTFDNQGNQISVLNANGYLENNDSSGLTVTSGADSYTKNYITHSTEHGEIGEYYFKEDGTRENLTSTGGTVTIDTSDYSEENGYVQYFGSTSIKINNPVTEDNSAFFTKAKHQFNDTSFNGKYVTFSAYVKTKDVEQIYSDGAIGATLAIECFNENGEKVGEAISVGITDTTDWQRLSVSILVPSDTAYFTVYCNLRNASGTAWFDCLQLEEGNSVNDFNALQNGDFESNDYWLTNDDVAISAQDGTVILNGTAGAYDDATTVSEEDSETETQPSTYYEEVTETIPNDIVTTYDDYGNVLKTEHGFVTRTVKNTYEVKETESTGEGTNDTTTEDSEETDDESTSEDTETADNSLGNKYIYQTVNVGRAGVMVNISGEAQAKSVPLSNENRTFGIALNIYYEGTTTPETHYQEFNASTTHKQTTCMAVTPEKTTEIISHVAFAFVYGNNSNDMTVHNAMLNIASAYADDSTDEETETENDDNIIDYEVISESVDTTQEHMVTSSTYDSTGNYVASETNEAGNTVTYTYDTNGNKTFVTDGKGNVVNYTYDTANSVTSVSSNGAENQYSYNGAGNISAISHNNFSYQFNYDVFNNLISTNIGNVALVSNTYSASNGNLTKTTYANGDFIEYTYDQYDNITKLTGENGIIAEFIYNKKGLVSKAIDNSSETTTYYYYDFNGTITGEYRQTDNGDLSYYLTYDSDGNKIEKTSINGQTKTITSGTDEEGKSYISNDGITVKTSTDNFDRKTEVKTSRGEGKTVFFSNYEYANGSVDNSTTNFVSKLTQKYGNDEIVNYEYTYDANGNITEIKQNGELLNKYTYDNLNQLKEEYDYINSFYINYSYDNSGNIQSKNQQYLDSSGYPSGSPTGNVYEYTDTSWKDKVTKINGDTITYDESGNPTTYRDGMIMTWVHGRQLTSLQTEDNQVNYKYDSNGMRTQKSDSNGTTNYYYDSDKNLIALTKGNDTLLFYYDSDGNVTSFSYNGTMYYYIKNLQGDVVKIIDYLGTEVANYVYDAWGNIQSETGEPNIRRLNPFRYRGYVYDEETGLYYLQSRYYDPLSGRFLNADIYCDTQTGTSLSTNMFAYCENNPISVIDKSGEFGTPLQWVMAAVGGIAGWFLGDYVAKKLGYTKGWKYWTIRAGVTIGGAVIGWFAGTVMLKIVTKFLLSHPSTMAKLPKIALWFLGLGGSSGQIANELFSKYAGHIFSKQHIKDGIMKLGSSQRNIFNKVFNIISSKITKAQNGSNEIHTTIKGFKVTIRFYFKDGKVTSVDAFMGWAKRVIGKLLK